MEQLLDVLREIGRAVKANIDKIPTLKERGREIEMGADGTPTSQIDKIAENTVLDYIARHDVRFNVLSEELGYLDNGYEETLVLDPIDGTNNAIAGVPIFAISMAVGKSKLSDIHTAYLFNPSTGEEWWAERGKGAYKDYRRLRVRKLDPNNIAMAIYLGSSSSPQAYDLAKRCAVSRSFGCTSLEMAMVADGQADGFYMNSERYSRGVRVVDIAASCLLVREAGGYVTDLKGDDLDMPFDLAERSNLMAYADPHLLVAFGGAAPETARPVYGIAVNPLAANAAACAKRVRNALGAAPVFLDPGAAAILGGESAEIEDMRIDTLITVGGDGTMLRAMMRTDSPVLGVNAGGVGFLAELDYDEIDEGISRLLAGDYRVEERFKLETSVDGKALEPAVNEAVIHTDTVAKIRQFRVYVDGALATEFRADGIIVSTPTGSTGYAMSLGAPLMDPSVDALVIVPMAAYKFTSRPFVVPADSGITVECVLDRGCLLVLDGQEEHHLAGCAKVDFGRSERKARFISFGKGFYPRVRSKLVSGP